MNNKNNIFEDYYNSDIHKEINKINQDTIDDLSNLVEAHGKSAAMGIKMNKIKFYDLQDRFYEKGLDSNYNLLKSTLSRKTGIKIQDIDEETLNSLMMTYKDDETIKSIMSKINKYKSEESDNLEIKNKLKIERDKYNNLEKEKLELINNIDNTALRMTSQLTTGVVQGVLDAENLVKNIAINYATLGFGKFAQIGKYGVKGLEYGLDFIDNYYSMQRENKLINPDGKEMTQEELIINSVAGLLVEGVFDGARYGISNIKKGIFGEVGGEIQKQVIKNIVENPEMDFGTSSSKQILKDVYDLENGKGQANIDLYKQEVKENPDMTYRPELDPQNPHEDIYDNAYDYKLNDVTENGEIYYEVNGSIEKVKIPDNDIVILDHQLNNKLITKDEYNTLKQNYIDNFTYKVDNNVDINSKMYPPKDYKRNKFSRINDDPLVLREGDNLTTKEKIINQYIYYDKAIENSKYANSTVIQNSEKTEYIYKNSNGDIVIQTERVGDINKPVKNIDNNNHYLVKQIKNAINKQTIVIKKNGEMKSINGMQKINYWGELKRLNLLPRVIQKGLDFANDIEPHIVQEDSRKFSIKGIMVNWSLGRIVDALFINDINSRYKNIVSNNYSILKDLMVDENGVPFYSDIESMLDDISEKALIEIFVKGDTSQNIFKTVRDNNDLAKEQLIKWVNILRENNAFLQAYKNNKNFIDTDITLEEFASTYGKFLSINEDGYLDFNTGKGGFFEGLNEKEVQEKILDLYINPEKIDLNMVDGINDRDMFNNIFGEVTLDRQNGMAIELAFDNRNQDLKILKQFGLITEDENGEIISSLQMFTEGICNIISEISNPNSNFNPNKLKYILSRFYDMGTLPKKINIKDGNVVGDVSINLIDYVFNNKSNSTIDMEGLHKVISPIIENLGSSINKKIEKIKPITTSNVENLSVDKIDFNNINKAVSILNRWKGIFTQDGKTNAYLLSDKFKKELEQVNKIFGEIEHNEAIPSKNIVNDIQAKEYDGTITFENISKEIDPAIDGVIDAIDNHDKLTGDFYDIKDTIGRKRKIEAIVNSDDYKNKVLNIEPKLKQLGISEETISKLKSTDIKEVRKAFKEIDKVISDTKKENNKAYSNLHDFEELTTPESIAEYLKHTRNREKIKLVLDTMEKYGIDKNIVEDVRDFINFHGKNFDYKLDKDSIINNIDTILTEINNFKGQLNVENYGERIAAYRELLNDYEQINNLIRSNTGEKSVMFIKNKNIEDLYARIKKNSEIVGEDISEILEYEKVLKNTQKILGEIQASNKNSPLKNLNKDFVGGYKSATKLETNNFGVLEQLINKGIWLMDRTWFVKTKEAKIVKALYSNLDGKEIKDIKDVPEGAAKKLINKRYMKMFENLYNYAVDKFRTVDELDDEGNIISSTPLTLDQFVFVYAKFLDELNNTKRSNKRQSLGALKVFFKDENSMFEFFTQRKKMYGTGYVKDNTDAITLFNNVNSMEFAEISKLGMTLNQFANKLNPNNKAIKNIVQEKLGSETIGGETRQKQNKELYDNTIRTFSKYLKNIKKKEKKGLIGYVEKNVTSFIDRGLNLIYPVLLQGTGLVESFTNDILSIHRTTYIDKDGKMFGYKSNNRVTGPAKQYLNGLKLGIIKGGITTPVVLYNGLVSAWNIGATLYDYYGLHNYIDFFKDKKHDFRIYSDSPKYVTDKIFGSNIFAKLTGSNRAIVKASIDAYISKKFMKGKHLYSNPQDLEFKGHKIDYMARSVSDSFNLFSDDALKIQEISDMGRDIAASLRSNYLMEEFISKDYDLLPEQIINQLKSFGIDENNYKVFQDSLEKLSNDGHIDIFLRDLFNQIDIDDRLKNIDTHMLGAIEGLANHFHETAFSLNKNHKYSVTEQDALSKIVFALKHSTLGMATEDLINLLYDEKSSGAYKFKLQRFSNENAPTIKDKGRVAYNMVANGVPSAFFFTMASAGVITAGMLADDLVRRLSDFRKDLANKRAEIEATKRIWQSDENEFNKTAKTLLYIGKKTGKNVLQVMPLTSFTSRNNIFDTYSEIAGDFYISLNELFNDPHEIDEKEFNKTLKSLGIRREYSKEEHLEKGNILPILSLMGSTFASKFTRTPYSIYKAITKVNDYQYHLDTAERLRKYNDTMTGEIAADIYMNSINKRLEPKDDELVSMPSFDNLNEYGEELVGTILVKNYVDTYNQLLDTMEANNIQANNALNQFAYRDGIYDDKQYTQRQMDLYKDMELDEKINELPEVYQWAISDVENTYDDINELDRNELRLLILNDIKEKQLSPNEIINKFSKNEEEINNIYKKDNVQKNISNNKYNSFDEIPGIYQMYYDDMLEKGENISEEDVIALANSSSPIPKIPE